MTMNEMDTTRRYTKYKRHVNDSTERIDATNVNQIQEAINVQESGINTIKDTAFQERLYTIFENNLFVNAMFLDIYENGNYIDMTQSKDIVINSNLLNVSIAKGKASGVITSSRIYSTYGASVKLNDFFLVTNQYTPVGTSIKYYLKLVTGEKYPISANALKTPLHLSNDLMNGFYLVAELQANNLGEYPIINDYGLLYWDAQVEENLGLVNPDLQRFP